MRNPKVRLHSPLILAAHFVSLSIFSVHPLYQAIPTLPLSIPSYLSSLFWVFFSSIRHLQMGQKTNASGAGKSLFPMLSQSPRPVGHATICGIFYRATTLQEDQCVRSCAFGVLVRSWQPWSIIMFGSSTEVPTQ